MKLQRGLAGFTLIELLITMAIGSVVILGVSDVMSRTLQARDVVSTQNTMTREARFAMQQMVQAVSRTAQLRLPAADNPLTTPQENIRQQVHPAVPPPADNGLGGAVLSLARIPLLDEPAPTGTEEEDAASVLFYLSGNRLIQRTPVPWDADGSGFLSDDDFVEEVIASQVSRVRVERLSAAGNRFETVAISLQLALPEEGVEVNLSTQVRVGSRRWAY